MNHTGQHSHDRYQPDAWRHSPPGTRRTSLRAKVAAAFATLAIGAGAGAYWSQFTMEPTTSAQAAQVQLAASSSGSERYGQFDDQRDCDTETLISDLSNEPAKASAWAGVVGISPTDIPNYLENLKPAALRTDTKLTHYSYEHDRYVPYPQVLAAGTWVLTNDRDEPRVECFDGAPLAPAPVYQRPGANPEYPPAQPRSPVIQDYGKGYPGENKPATPNPGPETGEPGGKPSDGKPDGKPGDGKPDGKPGDGKPDGKPGEPNPELQKKLAEAQRLADEAQERLRDKKVEAQIFETAAREAARDTLEKFRQLREDPENAIKQRAFQDAQRKSIQAQQEATAKANQLRMAESATRSAQNTLELVKAEVQAAQTGQGNKPPPQNGGGKPGLAGPDKQTEKADQPAEANQLDAAEQKAEERDQRETKPEDAEAATNDKPEETAKDKQGQRPGDSSGQPQVDPMPGTTTKPNPATANGPERAKQPSQGTGSTTQTPTDPSSDTQRNGDGK